MLVWYLCSRLDSLECEHGFDYIQEQCKPHFQKLPAGYFGGKTFNSTGYMEFKWAVVNISIKKKKENMGVSNHRDKHVIIIWELTLWREKMETNEQLCFLEFR